MIPFHVNFLYWITPYTTYGYDIAASGGPCETCRLPRASSSCLCGQWKFTLTRSASEVQ